METTDKKRKRDDVLENARKRDRYFEKTESMRKSKRVMKQGFTLFNRLRMQ